MTYQEAQEKARRVEWKAVPCNTENCWCRIITTKEPIKYMNRIGDDEVEDEYYIIGAGTVSKDDAEHIVIVHNNYLLMSM